MGKRSVDASLDAAAQSLYSFAHAIAQAETGSAILELLEQDAAIRLQHPLLARLPAVTEILREIGG